MIKRLIILIGFILIVLNMIYAQSEIDFEVKQNTDNTLTITGYKGVEKNIIIPSTLYGLKITVIGTSAFYLKEVISIVIPDTVITIEGGAFLNNPELIKVVFGNGLKAIHDGAFAGCTKLTEIIIPDSTNYIGNLAFCGQYNNIWGSRTSGKGNFKKIILGKGVQVIGGEAFSENSIEELEIPPSVKEIGSGAFKNNKIQKITFTSGLQIIGWEAFSNNRIEEVSLPSTLKVINSGAFSSNQIYSVNIPNSVTSLGNRGSTGVFDNNPLIAIVIPASLANGSLYGLSGNGSTITNVTIPDGMNESNIKQCFGDAFTNFWINQNRKGGKYIRRGPIWSKDNRVPGNLGAFTLRMEDNFQWAEGYEARVLDINLLNGHRITKGETYTLKIIYSTSRDLEGPVQVRLVDPSEEANWWLNLTPDAEFQIPASKAGEVVSTTVTLNVIATATGSALSKNIVTFTTKGKGINGTKDSGVQKPFNIEFTEFILTKVK